MSKEHKKVPVSKPELYMEVYHEDIYNGNERMKIVGIRASTVELEGDYSGGTHNVVQKSWMPISGLFILRKVCDNSCEPYV